jgi:hypothetical protein
MGANAARLWSVKSLHPRKNSEASASRRKRGGRLDKLGVTGSSPVPPITETRWQTAGFRVLGRIRRRVTRRVATEWQRRG